MPEARWGTLLAGRPSGNRNEDSSQEPEFVARRGCVSPHHPTNKKGRTMAGMTLRRASQIHTVAEYPEASLLDVTESQLQTPLLASEKNVADHSHALRS